MQITIAFWADLLRAAQNNVILAISAKMHLIYGNIREESGLLNLNVTENKEKWQIQNKWVVVPQIMATTSPDV